MTNSANVVWGSSVDLRSDSLIVWNNAGAELPPSHLHTFYGAAEVVKVAALGLLGFWAGPASTPRPASAPPGRIDAEVTM